VEPFIARVTVRLLPEIPVTRICNVPIRTVWPISSWVPSSTATVVLVVSIGGAIKICATAFVILAVPPFCPPDANPSALIPSARAFNAVWRPPQCWVAAELLD